MARTLLRGGRLLDPSTGRDEVADLLVEDGRIAASGPELEARGAEVIDATDRWVAPAFVDLRAHLREPGQEYKEDLASGGRAAVAGGFAAVACMPNTTPANDDPSVTEYVIERARQASPARIHPVAAATRGLEGKVMTEMVALRDAGAVAFGDDGRTIENALVMRRVLEYSTLVDAPVMVHAEERSLVGEGVVNEGPVSARLGLPANPAAAEEICVARDLTLAKLTGARLHIAHVSSAGAVERIRRARDEGVQVTAEATPHHLTLTDEAVLGFDTNTKMSPPLRSAVDVEAIRVALAQGVIDCIASDHAPHAVHEKEVDFCEAPPGVLGLETAFGVVCELVHSGLLAPIDLIDRMATRPARLLGLAGGSLATGAAADLVVLDPDKRWVYEPSKGYSKSRNSPWTGRELLGRVEATLVDGRLVYHVDRGVLVD